MPTTPAAAPELSPEHLAAACGLPAALTGILWSRGLRSAEAIHQFLHPAANQLHDPLLMGGMQAALGRLRAALLAREPILIYGDYDVDGTVATVLLKTALERAAVSLGVTPDIRYHIPHRIREGYGMRDTRIADAATEGVRLVVSVDTGIRAFAAAEEAARVGLDLIITDHHLPDGTQGVPHAVAVLNPNQLGCPYPCKDLCGAAVAFKLAQALLEATAPDADALDRVRTRILPSFLKLLAVATVADAVPLTGENRVIAALGLRALRQPAQSGLRTLMELAGIDLSRPITASDIGFRLGPRINAAGRMDIASDVVELFLTRDPAVARPLAEKLHALNDDRKATEQRALTEIEARLEAMQAAGTLPPCVVLDDTPTAPWHRGVIGILASRVVERTGRPALVLTHEDGEAHGSGRSVEGFHLLDTLSAAHCFGTAPLFSRFGGHAHAAGFSLPSAHVALLRDRMEQLASSFDFVAFNTGPQPEAELALRTVDRAFLTAYEALAPFGHGNPEPLFATRNLRLCAPVRVIKDRHVALQLADPAGGRPWRATAWARRTPWAARAQAEGWQPGEHFDVHFRLTRNWHPDFGGWELEVLAFTRTAS